MKINGDNNFQCCESVFQAYIYKLIGIDTTCLSGKNPSILLMTTTVDDNDKLIHVSFLIAEVECDLAWEWFLTHPIILFAVDPSTMTIVFNRYCGIIFAVSKVYPTTHNAFCCYYLSCNMVTYTS